jgi:hypothetical protein
VEHIRKIHQLVHSDIIKIVKAEWRNIFLNYIFMGCLPQGVEKARLYIGDALTLPLREAHSLRECELIFVCLSSTGKELHRKAEGYHNRRTLKLQLKKRSMESVNSDSSKLGRIQDLLKRLVNLKKLNQ